MPSRRPRPHTNPELGDFTKGRESHLNRAILRLLAARPGLNTYSIAASLNESYPTVYRRVMDLFENPFWWLHVKGYVRMSKNPNMSSKAFALSLPGVLAMVALYYDDSMAVSDLKKNYDLYFPVYFANRVNHPLADSWLIEGIGAAFMSDRLSINMSWDYVFIHATGVLARRRRVLEKAGEDVKGLGITEELLEQFWEDTNHLDQSGWDKVTRLLDPKNGTVKHAIELLRPY